MVFFDALAGLLETDGGLVLAIGVGAEHGGLLVLLAVGFDGCEIGFDLFE